MHIKRNYLLLPHLGYHSSLGVNQRGTFYCRHVGFEVSHNSHQSPCSDRVHRDVAVECCRGISFSKCDDSWQQRRLWPFPPSDPSLFLQSWWPLRSSPPGSVNQRLSRLLDDNIDDHTFDDHCVLLRLHLCCVPAAQKRDQRTGWHSKNGFHQARNERHQHTRHCCNHLLFQYHSVVGRDMRPFFWRASKAKVC